MSLNKTIFKDNFKNDVVENICDTVEQAAENWKDVYSNYAKNGQTAYGAMITNITSTAKQSLKTSLISTFESSNSLSQFNTNMNSNFLTFWTTPGNIIFSPTTSIVSSVAGVLNFSETTTPKTDSVDTAVQNIVNLLHNYTKTVTITDSSSGATGTLI